MKDTCNELQGIIPKVISKETLDSGRVQNAPEKKSKIAPTLGRMSENQ